MSFALLGAAVALGAFATAASLLSLLAAVVWRGRLARGERGREPFDAAPRAHTLFRLRLLPTLGAFAAVCGLVVPAFLLFEPRGTGERVEGPLALLAGVGVLLVASGGLRAWRAWRATRRLAWAWRRRAEPLDLPDAPAPTYVFEHAFPSVSLVGVRQPRLFLARQVLGALQADELRAVMAHEAAHLAARDNVRALLMRACPDPLAWLPLGARVARAWARAAEAAADDRAAGSDPARALDLASALVKLARLAPAGSRPASAVSAIEGDPEGLAERVERLLARAADTRAARAPAVARQGLPMRAPVFGSPALAALSAAAAAVALTADVEVLRAVHDAVEHAVNFLR